MQDFLLVPWLYHHLHLWFRTATPIFYALPFVHVHAYGLHGCDLSGCSSLFRHCLCFPPGTGSVKLPETAPDLAYEAWLLPAALLFPGTGQSSAPIRRNGLCSSGTGHFHSRKTACRKDLFFFYHFNPIRERSCFPCAKETANILLLEFPLLF